MDDITVSACGDDLAKLRALALNRGTTIVARGIRIDDLERACRTALAALASGGDAERVLREALGERVALRVVPTLRGGDKT